MHQCFIEHFVGYLNQVSESSMCATGLETLGVNVTGKLCTSQALQWSLLLLAPVMHAKSEFTPQSGVRPVVKISI